MGEQLIYIIKNLSEVEKRSLCAVLNVEQIKKDIKNNLRDWQGEPFVKTYKDHTNEDLAPLMNKHPEAIFQIFTDERMQVIAQGVYDCEEDFKNYESGRCSFKENIDEEIRNFTENHLEDIKLDVKVIKSKYEFVDRVETKGLSR